MSRLVPALILLLAPCIFLPQLRLLVKYGKLFTLSSKKIEYNLLLNNNPSTEMHFHPEKNGCYLTPLLIDEFLTMSPSLEMQRKLFFSASDPQKFS